MMNDADSEVEAADKSQETWMDNTERQTLGADVIGDNKSDEDRESGDDDKDADETDSDEPLLQDRGWAWLVMLGCFLSHLITGGLERSDGVFFLKMTARYHSSAQVTAWAGALAATVMFSLGPVASAVCSRFSARSSVMAGAFIYSLGLICSGLAPNMTTLLVCFGLLQASELLRLNQSQTLEGPQTVQRDNSVMPAALG